MSAEQELRRAYIMVHNAEKLARHALDPATFAMLVEDFDRLIRTLDELAKVELFLGEPNGDSSGP